MTARRRWLVPLVVFIVALGVRTIYIQQLSGSPFVDERELVADASYYDMRGREIAAGDLIGDAPGFLSPLYCITVATLYKLATPHPLAVKWFQVLLGSVSCVLLFSIGRRHFGDACGLIAGLTLALYGPHVYYTGLLLPAILVVFLHLVLILVLGRPPSVPVALVAGALIGLAVLAKSNAILLLPAVALGWIVFRGATPLGRSVRIGAILFAAALATIAPLTAANYRVSGSFLLVTTTGGSNLLKGNGPTATGTHTFLPLGAQFTGLRAHLDHTVESRTAVEQSRTLSRRALGHALSHPGHTVVLYGKKLVLIFNRRELAIRDSFEFARGRIPILGLPLCAFWAVAPLGLVGLWLARERRRDLFPLHAVLAVQLLSFLLIFVLARYRLVAVACLMPFAAHAAMRFLDAIRGRDRRGLLQVVVPWLALLGLAFVPLAEFPRDRGWADQYKFIGDRHAAAGEHAAAIEVYRVALASRWQDARREQLQRWDTMLDLARSEIASARNDAALRTLETLENELLEVDAGRTESLRREIERLRERLSSERRDREAIYFESASKSSKAPRSSERPT